MRRVISKKWGLRIGLAVVIVAAVAFLGISIYLGYSMTKVKRMPVEENPETFGLGYEEVSFPSRIDELTMRGWFLPASGSDHVIIMVHGADLHRADSSIGMLDIAAELVNHGYNVLMFDLRGHGESDGDRMSAGYYERRDLLGSIDYVKGCGFESIGVLGYSMGAATALMTAAENDDIAAIVSDSSFADLNDIMGPEFSRRTRFPRIFLRPLLFMVKVFYKIDFAAVKPVEFVSQIAPRPILFIHGKADETIPVEHASILLEASQNPQNQLWVVPDASHVRAYETQPEEYINRVTAFFDDILK